MLDYVPREGKGTKAAKKDDEGTPYRALAVYARQLFDMCLTAIVTGMLLAQEKGLADQLKTFDERLHELCKTLESNETTNEAMLRRIAGAVWFLQELQTPREPVSSRALIGAAKRLFRCALDVGLDVDDTVVERLKQFGDIEQSSEAEKLQELVDLSKLDAFRRRYYGSGIEELPAKELSREVMSLFLVAAGYAALRLRVELYRRDLLDTATGE